jgi:hypothetical protein
MQGLRNNGRMKDERQEEKIQNREKKELINKKQQKEDRKEE